MKINTVLFATRRRQAMISQRALARHAGTTLVLVRKLEESGDATHTPLGVLGRLAEALGVTVSALLDEGRPVQPEEHEDEGCAREADDHEDELDGELIRALRDHPMGLTVDTLTGASGRSPGDISNAMSRVNKALHRTGLRVLHVEGLLVLSGAERKILSDEAVSQSSRVAGTRATLNSGDYQLVYEAWRGTRSVKAQRSNANGYLRIGKLVRAGILEHPELQSQSMLLATDVRYSLGIEDERARDSPGLISAG